MNGERRGERNALTKGLGGIAEKAPPHLWFALSALSRYLGPSFAVLLFPAVGVLGMAWIRVASAALVFAPLTKPWRTYREADAGTQRLLLALGTCLAVMNTAFYLALDRLPMSLVAALEFMGSIGVALYGLRTWRNAAALLVAAVGVLVLIDIRWESDPVGLAWAALNAAMFVTYIVLGHRAAEAGAGAGVNRLGVAMAVAFLLLTPIGLLDAIRAFGSPVLIAAGIGVGICSSVVPYVCDQFAMSRLSRGSFALLLVMLPALATVIAVIVLAQIPSRQDLVGLALVSLGIALHRPAAR